jgi:hypothetical protein
MPNRFAISIAASARANSASSLGACIEADNSQLSGLVPKRPRQGGVPNPALTEAVNLGKVSSSVLGAPEE